MILTNIFVLASLVVGSTDLPSEQMRMGTYCKSLDKLEYALELFRQGADLGVIVTQINKKVPRSCFASGQLSVETGKLHFVKAVPQDPDLGIYTTTVYWALQRTVLADGAVTWWPQWINADFYTVQPLQQKDSAAP